MLLANISVATKIHECFPDLAVLRCHPEPKQQILDRSVQFLQRFGIDIDGSTSKTLQNSLNCYKPGMYDYCLGFSLQISYFDMFFFKNFDTVCFEILLPFLHKRYS